MNRYYCGLLILYIMNYGLRAQEVDIFTVGKELVLSTLLSTNEPIDALFFVPDDQVKVLLIGLIEHEQKYIRAALYRLTDKDITNALLRAQQRGVLIEIIADSGGLYDKHDKIAILQEQGIPMYIYHGHFSIMHNKLWLFERNITNLSLLWAGSANATNAGTTRNEELVMIRDNQRLYNKCAAKFERLKNKLIKANLINENDF